MNDIIYTTYPEIVLATGIFLGILIGLGVALLLILEDKND
jgi:hypothetical protein